MTQHTNTVSEETVERVKAFHGHTCPGSAIGIRAAAIALERIGPHATDEEVVAVVETDMCAVDAIQVMTGCTFGKGNLIHRDYGKNAFTFFRRSDGKAIRIVTKPLAWGDPSSERRDLLAKLLSGTASEQERQRFRQIQAERTQAILSMPVDALFDIQPVNTPPPPKARLHESLVCEGCGEEVMETRVRRFSGRNLCIPCYDRASQGRG